MSHNKKITLVGNIMEERFALVDGLITVAEAIKIIKEKDAKALIIQKRHEHDELGMVLLSDIAKKVIGQDKAPGRVNVYEIMTKPVISVHSGMNVKYCARLFQQFGISRAPVIDDGVVKGMVSYTNMVHNAE